MSCCDAQQPKSELWLNSLFKFESCKIMASRFAYANFHQRMSPLLPSKLQSLLLLSTLLSNLFNYLWVMKIICKLHTHFIPSTPLNAFYTSLLFDQSVSPVRCKYWQDQLVSTGSPMTWLQPRRQTWKSVGQTSRTNWSQWYIHLYTVVANQSVLWNFLQRRKANCIQPFVFMGEVLWSKIENHHP